MDKRPKTTTKDKPTYRDDFPSSLQRSNRRQFRGKPESLDNIKGKKKDSWDNRIVTPSTGGVRG